MSVASFFRNHLFSQRVVFQPARTEGPSVGTSYFAQIDIKYRRPWGVGLFSLSDIRAWVNDRIIELQKQITTLLRQVPASAEGTLTLLPGPGGSIMAVGNHPYRHALMDYINGNPDLVDNFLNLAATASFLYGAEESREFQKAYRKNPETAVAQFKDLFRNYTFGLHIQGELVNPYIAEPVHTSYD